MSEDADREGLCLSAQIVKVGDSWNWKIEASLETADPTGETIVVVFRGA